MNVEQAIDKTLELLSNPRHDRRKVLQAFASTVTAQQPAAVSRCPGCGATNPLCAPCAVKQKIGNTVLNALQGFASEVDGRSHQAPPAQRAQRQGPPAVYQGQIQGKLSPGQLKPLPPRRARG